jgi:hypothetical protein
MITDRHHTALDFLVLKGPVNAPSLRDNTTRHDFREMLPSLGAFESEFDLEIDVEATDQVAAWIPADF